jgi:hypothetical protein
MQRGAEMESALSQVVADARSAGIAVDDAQVNAV